MPGGSSGAVIAGAATATAAAPPSGAPAAASKGLPAAAPAATAAAGKDSAIARLLGLAGLQLSTVPQPESMAAPVAGPLAAAAGATVHIQALLQKKLAEDEELLQSFCKGMRAYLQVRLGLRRCMRLSSPPVCRRRAAVHDVQNPPDSDPTWHDRQQCGGRV